MAAPSSPSRTPAGSPSLRPIMIVSGMEGTSCGVSDHAHVLGRALATHGVEVENVSHRHWGVRDTIKLLRRARSAGAIVVLEYPTLAYRTSFIPHVLAACGHPVVLVLHEWTAAHPLRQHALRVLLALVDGCIATTSYEAQHIRQATGRTVEIVPLFSSVAPSTARPSAEDEWLVGYFGRIAPEKGIESYLETAGRMRRTCPGLRFRLTGQVDPRLAGYAEQILSRAASVGVEPVLDLPVAQVGEELASWDVAYLPFPDGVSERRSSLLAVLSAGVAVVSHRGPATTSELEAVVTLVGPGTPADEAIAALLAAPDRRRALSEAGRRYLRTKRPEEVAARFLEVLDRLVGRSM